MPVFGPLMVGYLSMNTIDNAMDIDLVLCCQSICCPLDMNAKLGAFVR